MTVRDRLPPFKEDDVKAAIAALDTVRSAWLRDPAVVALDVGYRLDTGKPKPSPAHLYFKKEKAEKRRLCSEDLAYLTGRSLPAARQAADERLDTLPEEVEHEAYGLPWIRVHVDRRLTPNQVETLGRYPYHQGLVVNGKRFEVQVVEALYKPLAQDSNYVTREEFREGISEITRSWRELQEQWAAIQQADEELHHDLGRETDNRRKADSRIRTEVREELRRHGIDLEQNQLWTSLAERYRLSYLEGSAFEMRQRAEPLTGGVSIGNKHYAGGTLGAIVWDKTDCRPCLLSNWHVLAGGPVKVGEPCLQPSIHDGGTLERDTVARLKRWRVSRHVDAAIADLTGRRSYSAGSIVCGPNDLFGRGSVSITGVSEESLFQLLGQPVWKCGRTSGLTEGTIDGVSMSLCVTYADGSAEIFFDQLHILPACRNGSVLADSPVVNFEVSQAGDSGSLWLDVLGRAVGLQFAGDTTNSPLGDFAVANRMRRVADELGISITPVFTHPRVLERRRREEQLVAAVTDSRETGGVHDTAHQLLEVLAEVLSRTIERFDAEDVQSAMGQIREAIGPHPRPTPKPPGG